MNRKALVLTPCTRWIVTLAAPLVVIGNVRADYVVGTGTPASCTAAELRNALDIGGSVSFDCGAAPAVITLDASYDSLAAAPAVIDGGGAITVDGAGLYRIFRTLAHPLTIKNIALRNARPPGNSYGGAIYVGPGPGASLTVQQSTISGNAAAFGGAAIWSDGGAVTISGSTIFGNEAGLAGLGAVAAQAGTMLISNSTIEGFAEPVGVVVATGTAFITVHHSTVTVGTNSGPALFASMNGTIEAINSIVFSTTSASVCTVIGNASNILGGSDNVRWGGIPGSACNAFSNADPRLGPLQDNGGPTPTMALLPGSGAIDAANSASCITTDQRGGARIAPCDSGAFEFGALPLDADRIFASAFDA